MKNSGVVAVLFAALIANPLMAENLHLICTGKKLVSGDPDPAWSSEITVDLETAELLKFDTTWYMGTEKHNYSFEAYAEIDLSTIKIIDRVIGDKGVWERTITISRVDGMVEAIVTKTGTVSIRSKCTPAADRAF